MCAPGERASIAHPLIFELEKDVTEDIAGPNGCGKINQHGPMHDHYLAPDVFSSNPFTMITNSAGSTGLDTCALKPAARAAFASFSEA